MRKSDKKLNAKVVPIVAPGDAYRPLVTCLGAVTSWSAEEGLSVDYPGNARGPRAALSTVALSVEDVHQLIASRQPVLLAFERGEAAHPVVIGVVQQVGTQSTSKRHSAADDGTARAVVDGREVVLEGHERVELRCGKARIVLTKAGKIIIEGTYISSRSAGAHRIRGGSVEVN